MNQYLSNNFKQIQTAWASSPTWIYFPYDQTEGQHECPVSIQIPEGRSGRQNHPSLTCHTRVLLHEAKLSLELSKEIQTLHSKMGPNYPLLPLFFSLLNQLELQLCQPVNKKHVNWQPFCRTNFGDICNYYPTKNWFTWPHFRFLILAPKPFLPIDGSNVKFNVEAINNFTDIQTLLLYVIKKIKELLDILECRNPEGNIGRNVSAWSPDANHLPCTL